jgi:hypothetical protein
MSLLSGRERYNFCLRLIPIIVDRKRVRFEGVLAGVFASIDVYLYDAAADGAENGR